MADERLRELERQAAQGDERAREQLIRLRIRQGELPRNTFLLTPRERVDAWLEVNHVEGVEVRPAEVDANRNACAAPFVDGAVQLRWWVSYGDPDQLRVVLANLIETLEWCDPARVAIQPVARLGHFEVVVDLYLYAPQRMFKGPECLQALNGATPTHLHLCDVANGVYERALADMTVEEQARIRQGMSELLFTGFSSDGRRGAEAFEASLKGAFEHVVRDVRLGADLGRSHRGLMRNLDDWVHRDRIDGTGAVVGKEFFLPVWTTYQSSTGVNTLPELRETEEAEPESPQAEELYSMVANDSLDDRARRDACSRLMDLPAREGHPWNVRALGVLRYTDICLHRALRRPELGPFFAKLAMSVSLDRVDYALQLMRGYGVEFDDPLEAWLRSESGRVRALTSHHQDTILYNLPEAYPPVVPLIVAELERLAERAPTGVLGAAFQGLRRLTGSDEHSTDWMQAALSGLCSAHAASASPAALALTEHFDAGVRRAALGFFRGCDEPMAVPILLAALDEDDMDVVIAAEQGLSGQTSMSTDALYGALERADQRAASASEDSHFASRTLGTQLLRALAKAGPPADEERRRLVLRVSERSPWLPAEAKQLVALVRHAPAQDADRGPATGDSPVATFELRYATWRRPGYVALRYEENGHCDRAWDDAVRAAHAHYDAERYEQAQPLYRSAADAGCEDGLVLYRLAVTCLQDSDKAIPLLQAAAQRIPERYPDSPYGPAAWEGLGHQLARLGREDEALDAYHKASGHLMCPPKVPELLAKLGSRVSLRRIDPGSVKVVGTAGLRPWPSRWHLSRVTSIAVNPAGGSFASADERGWIQISTASGMSDVLPIAGEMVHAAGPVTCAWVDGEVLLSVGIDGRLCRCQRTEDVGELTVEDVWRHDRPLTALAVLPDGRAVVGDDAGDVRLIDGEATLLEGRLADAPVARILVNERWVVAQDGQGRLEVWALDGLSPVFVERRALTFVTFHDDGLAVGLGGGNGVCLELPSGRQIGPYRLPRAGQPLYVRSAIDGGVFVWPRGPIEITAGNGLLSLINDPLAVVDTVPETGLVAYADTSHKLGVTTFQP